MATKLFVNVQADSLSRSLVRSETDLASVDFADLVVGDSRAYELFFVDGRGSFEAWSGNASYTPMLALGECGAPTGGTFTLTFGANTTSALAYNISTAALQTALEGLASIGSGNVTVTGSAGAYYIITFVGSLADTNVAEITPDATLLSPTSNIDVSTLTAGGGGANEVQLITLELNPLVFANDWVPITNGWSGTLTLRTLELVQKFTSSSVEGVLETMFQITVIDPSSNRSTYAKTEATIRCTTINPESYAGSAKPTLVTAAELAAAVLAANGFSWQTATSSGAGNTNITRPATTSRHHTATVAVTGAASTRTLAIQTTNTPAAGDTILLLIEPDNTPANVVELRNSTSGGTLLGTITTTDSEQAVSVLLTYTGTAWQVTFSSAEYFAVSGNLAGVPLPTTARANLRTPFSRISAEQTASFSLTSADDGMFVPISCASGDVVATIPAAASVPAGFALVLQKTDSTSSTVTTSPATATLSIASETALLISDGTNWRVAQLSTPQAATPAVANYSTLTGLTGGGATNLDGVVTAGGAVATGQIAAITRVVGGGISTRFWQLVDGTDAESTHVVRPDDYNASTNPRVWKSAGGNNRRTAYANSTGNSTITITPPNGLAVVTVTGTASTRILVLSVADLFDGDRLAIRLLLPATADIIVEIRNSATGGTLLYSVTSEADAVTYFFDLYFDGSAWQPLSNLGPVI